MADTLRLLQRATRYRLYCTTCDAAFPGCGITTETPAEFAGRAQAAGWTATTDGVMARAACPRCTKQARGEIVDAVYPDDPDFAEVT